MFSIAFAMAAAVAWQTPSATPAAQFREVGASALPGVTTTCGAALKDYIIEVNGGGLALGDFDGDGRIDLVVVDGSTLERVEQGDPGFPPRLFLNRSDTKGLRFEPAPAAFAMSGGRWGMGCATGDFNADGWLDLVVTQWGPTRLFLNQGGQGLRELSSEESGLVGERWGTSAAAWDYDLDGNLDLAVINYLAFDPHEIISRTNPEAARWKGMPVMSGPEGLTPLHDQLFRNLGGGKFEDVSFASGFRPSKAGFGLGVLTLDYDGDGDTDLYVANDSTDNFLWEAGRTPEGLATLTEVGLLKGVARDTNGKEQAGMGLASADLNGDGRPEIFVTNFSGENNALYLTTTSGNYRERSDALRLGGPSKPYLGWGTGFHDFDLDGDLDIFVLNGHVYPQADGAGTDTSYAQQAHLYRQVQEPNRTPGGAPNNIFKLEPLSDAGARVARAGAAADLDRDGDLDLVALDLGGPVRVLENLALQPGKRDPNKGWLSVQLHSRGANTQALGARIGIKLGERTLWGEVRTSGGFQAAVPAEVHFGLGAAPQKLEQLTVLWPGGREQVLRGVAIDQVLLVEEAE